jgi:hypothetical protein
VLAEELLLGRLVADGVGGQRVDLVPVQLQHSVCLGCVCTARWKSRDGGWRPLLLIWSGRGGDESRV